MSYESVSHFAQTWGLLLFVALFVIALAYALWPRNRGKFDRAARTPLEEGRPGEPRDGEASGGEEDRTDG